MKLSLKMPGKHAWRRFLSKAVFPLAAVLLILGVARWWKQPGPAATSPIAASQKDATPAAKAGLLAAEKAAASAPNSNQSKQALPPATPAIDEPESLWNAFSKARHEVQTLTEREAGLPQNRGVRYFAANPGQQLTARFLDQGVRIESGRGGGWQGTVQVTKLSRGGEPAVLPAAAAPTANGNRVEYQRGDVVEWYENRTEGIEHGFTVAKKPVANGPEDSPLQIDLNFGLKASMQAGGKAVQFEAAAGMPVMSYGDLRVWDARGTSVKAEMKVAGEGVSILVADAGAVYPLTIDPIIATLEQKLGPEVTGSGAAGDRFGTGVAVEGDTALIGVPGDDTAAGDNAGSAFVFLRTGSIWSQQARLTATDGTEDQSFGGAVSLSGNTAIVGALPAVQQPSANQEPPPVAGKAYVFVRSGTTWTQQAILTPGAESNMSFGNAVAVAGETALVGDAGANRVHVFLRTGTAWASQSVLVPVDGLPFDGFGAAVSLSGDTALIGAPFASESLPIVTSVLGASPEKIYNGAAYMFLRTGTSWSQQDKKLGENSYDLFGQAVSVFGDTALVGAPGVDTTPGFEDGQAYVYERQGSSWSLDAFLTHPGGVGGDFFGAAVALGEDRALVGAPGTNTAYVFERSASAGASVASVQVISPWNQTALLKAADADGHDSFGCPLALSGDTALIGAPGDDTPGGEAAGTAFVFVHGDDACCGTGAPSESGGWCQQARLSLGDGAVDDFFGRPVALDGNTAAVGAQGDDTAAGVDTGTVYIFVRAGTVWTNQARLVALDAVSYSGFGRSLAVLGNTVLAGAPDANNQTGCAYVFIRTGTLWAQAAKLTGKSGAEGDSFGRSVTLSGNTAAIGAFGDTTPAGQAAGSVYVFTGAASKWVQQAQLMASDAAAFDLFGQSVSMSGQTLLVGAMGDDATAAGEERGCAYVFLRVGKVWGQQAKLVPDDVANMDYVGHSVSLFGNVALVGSDGADLPGQANAGAAYVFERSGASWTQQTKLTASGGAASDGFGIYVALNDGLALIGAPGDDTGAGMDAGSAYLFAENSSGLWTQQAQLTAGIDGAAGDFFGGAVALSPTIALVGASLDDGVDVFGDVAMNRGSVYVFSLLDTTPPEIAVQQPLGTGLTDGQMTPVDFGEVVVGMKGALVFKIINEGGTTLSGIKITIDGANKAEFKVVTAPPLTLAAKGEMTFSVTFGPTATGLRVAALHIASNDSDENPFDIILNGTGLPPVAPTISELQDLLVPVGAGVKFAPKVTGLPPPVIVWRRNGAVVANAKTAILALRAQLTSTGVTNAGLYLITATNSAGSASQSAELGVVDTSSKTLILPTGATATMVVRSAGNGLTHSWLMDNLPLMLDSRITTSANGKTLTIKNLVLDDAALYACLVTGPGGELLGGFHQLIVIDEHPMILEPVYMPNGIVGGAYKFTIPVDSDPIRTPTSYGATGLPAGLSVNPVTGVISGRPTVSGLFNVMLSASNFWGKATVSTSLYISPLPSLGCGAVGTFNGLVNRDGGVNGGFGGTLVLTTVAKGTFTGQLGLAGVKYPFSGSMVIADKGFPHAKVVVSRASSSLGPVILEFSLDDYEGILDGTITDKAVFPYQISDLAGSPLVPDYADGTGIQARFNGPQGIARDKAGNLYVADKNNHVIRKITPAGVVTTIGGKAGFCGSTDGPLAVALFNCPQGVAVDAAGNIYVADSGNMVIRKISPAGIVSTVAGSAGISGSVNGTGAAARFVCPISIVVDSAGNLFVCDHEDHTIRKITPAGVVTTFAGKSATPGTTNGSGASARFNSPKGLAIDSSDRLLVADTGNHAIRAISKGGAVTIFAGLPGVPGFADGLRANARFYGPCGVAVDAQGTVFVADTLNYTLRRVNKVGVVTTVGGKVGLPGIAGGVDGTARFTLITGLVANAGTVFITDAGAHLVRKGAPKAAVPVDVLARRNPWGTDQYTQPSGAKVARAVIKTEQGSCFNPPASSYVGNHNLAFELPSPLAGNSAYPQGNGFVTLTITSTGIVTWTGFMADGTPTTGSTMLGGVYYYPFNYIPLHFMLYGNTGSAQGWQNICVDFPQQTATARTTASPVYDVLIDGVLDWMKIPQLPSLVRSYAEGILLHDQTTMGENNNPPDSGIVLGYHSGADNAILRFFEGGLNPEFSQLLTISNTNVASTPAAGPDNPKNVKFTTFSAASSKFAGTFVLKEANPIPGGTPAEVTRTPTTFNGVLLRRLGHGVGYSLIGELPSAGPPATTVTTSPIQSGQVILEEATQTD